MPTRRIFIGSPIRRSGPECSPSVIQRVASVVRRSASCYPSFAEEEQSEDIIMQKPFKSCRGSRRRRPAWAHGRARERVGRRQQLQGHFITGFGDRTERKLVYGRARRVRECGARRPDQWAVGRWRPVPRQRARAVATEERLPADRRRRRRRPR